MGRPRHPRRGLGPTQPASRSFDETNGKPFHFGRNADDGILYSGNRHESVPRALYLDRRLTPLEHTAWVVIRFMIQDAGITAFPTYAQLRPYLTSTPRATQASDETVARALMLLRLTRWLSLVRRQRDPATGRVLGNLYVLHDVSLAPYEAIQLDPTYLELVSHALSHASKVIQHTGHDTLKELAADPLLHGRVLPSRLQLLIDRVSREESSAEKPRTHQPADKAGTDASPRSTATGRTSPDAKVATSQGASPSSASEVGCQSRNTSLRNPKSGTVRTIHTNSIYNGFSTVQYTAARNCAHLHLPEDFTKLPPEQQSGALMAVLQLPLDLQQPVFDEWAARCRVSAVRKPAAYLFGLIQRALRGEFHPWASQRSTHSNSPGMPPPLPAGNEQTHDSPEPAAFIAELRNRMRIP